VLTDLQIDISKGMLGDGLQIAIWDVTDLPVDQKAPDDCKILDWSPVLESKITALFPRPDAAASRIRIKLEYMLVDRIGCTKDVDVPVGLEFWTVVIGPWSAAPKASFPPLGNPCVEQLLPGEGMVFPITQVHDEIMVQVPEDPQHQKATFAALKKMLENQMTYMPMPSPSPMGPLVPSISEFDPIPKFDWAVAESQFGPVKVTVPEAHAYSVKVIKSKFGASYVSDPTKQMFSGVCLSCETHLVVLQKKPAYNVISHATCPSCGYNINLEETQP
jgi:hypothetical protein